MVACALTRLSTSLESTKNKGETHELGSETSNHAPAETGKVSLYHEKKKRKIAWGKEKKEAALAEEDLPNALEVANLQQGKQLYGSNLFRLEVEELLKSVTVDYTKLSELETFLRSFKGKLDNLSEKSVEDPLDVQYPFMYFSGPFRKHGKYSHAYTFRAPTRCDIVGSYLLKMLTRPNLNIDLAVEMPADMFKPKDYLNYRYFNKRAAYVAELFLQLRKAYPHSVSEEFQLSQNNQCSKTKLSGHDAFDESLRCYFFIQAHHGDVRRPIIVIKFLISRRKASVKGVPVVDTHKCTAWTVRIFPVPPRSLFPEERLAPSRNAVRFCSTSRIAKELHGYIKYNETTDHADSDALPPSPMYNGAVLDDILMRAWLERLHCTSTKFEGFQKAVQLLKAWAFTKGHCSSWCASDKSSLGAQTSPLNLQLAGSTDSVSCHDISMNSGITGFLLTLLCSHVCLAESATLMRASALQIFRMTLAWLAEVEFRNTKVIYGKSVPVGLSDEERLLGLKLMMDAEGLKPGAAPSYNILWNSQLFIDELQALAKEAVQALDGSNNPFSAIFGETGQQPQYFMTWDTLLYTAGVKDVSVLLPECAVAVSHEADAARQRRLASAKKEPTNAVDKRPESAFLDLHIEHPPHYHLAGALRRVLQRALGDRIDDSQGVCVRFFVPQFPYCNGKPYEDTAGVHQHAVDVPPFSWTNCHALWKTNFPMMGVVIGVRCAGSSTVHDALKGDPLQACSTLWRLVDRGYPVESAEADAFGHFWENSSVRRFKDGSINRSVVWEQPALSLQNTGLVLRNPEKGRKSDTFVPSVFVQIIEHILQRHFGECLNVVEPGNLDTVAVTKTHCVKKGCNAALVATTLENANRLVLCNANLELQHKPVAQFYSIEDGVSIPHPISSFSEFKSVLFGLSELPLAVREVRSADETGALHFADLPVYAASSVDSFITEVPASYVLECVVEFEKAGGWPTESQGIKWMKVALLVALRSSLLEAAASRAEIGGMSKTNVSDEAEEWSFVEEPFLDVELAAQQTNQANTCFRLPRIIFRLRIFHPPEHLAVASDLTDPATSLKALWKTRSFHETSLEAIRKTWWRPLRNSSLYAAALEFSVFANALRLCLVWACAQLFPLSEVHDLFAHLCLYVYRNPACLGGPPRTALIAFLRVLALITQWDWDSTGMFIQYHDHQESLTREHTEALKAARQRCFDLICTEKSEDLRVNVEERSEELGGRRQTKTNPQFPFFWISSLDDPHCQFIRLPNYSRSKHLVSVAKVTLSLAKQLSFGSSVDTLSGQVVNLLGANTVYPWASPLVSFLSENSWRQLFNPKVSCRFDAVIHLRHNSLGLTRQALSSLSINAAASDVRKVAATKRSFSNVKNGSATPASTSTAINPLAHVTAMELTPSLSIVVNACASTVHDALQNKIKTSTWMPSLFVEKILQAVNNPSIDPLSETQHLQDTVDALRASFDNFVKAAQTLLSPIADLYYDVLAMPFPTALFVKFNPEAMTPSSLVPSLVSNCPKAVFFVDPNTVNEECKSLQPSSSDSAVELVNIPLVLGTLQSLGHGLVERIELL